MIGKLTGIVDSIAEDAVILDVNGVGYLVQCPASTLSRLAAGAHASLMIEMKVSEDAIKLYGFASAEEREWFRLLQTVQNVGGKVALSVLSTLSPRELQRALALGDKAMIGRAPGVGPKLALRIATELKDKAPAMMLRGEDDALRAAGACAARARQPMRCRRWSSWAIPKARPPKRWRARPSDLGEHAETGALIREALKGMAQMSRKNERLVTPERSEDDALEASLRPKRLADFVGQQQARENLSVFIDAAKARGEALDHVLFSGPPGLGKTTLAQIVARELGVNFRSTSGPVLAKAGDLAAILTNLEPRDVLFIDEIHRLNPAVEEILYPAMEDYELDLVIGEGPAARSVKIQLAPFTLVGATTRSGLITTPLRDRFGIPVRLNFYTRR